MLAEFKKFIFKGDVVALSTGILIGAAFGKIVDAFTKGVVDPILRLFGDDSNVSLGIKIGEFKEPVMEKGEQAKDAAGELMFRISPNKIDLGLIINSTISFVITAAVIFFLVVKPYQKLLAMMKAKEAAAPPSGPTPTEALLAEIRDSLKK